MSLVPLFAHMPRTGSVKGLTARKGQTRYWKRGLGFFFGLCIQFDVLIGGGGERASATGGYGYRLIDFAALGAVCILAFYSLSPRRILPVIIYGLVVGLLFVTGALSIDPRTAILAYHYILYCFAALYLAVILDDVIVLEWFCWGLIVGLLATIPIFVAQDSDYSAKLVEWGLAPGYATFIGGTVRAVPRYAGLGSHPNETGHVAALTAAAGAYFMVARRRFLPSVLVAAGLMVVFYYTWSRGGFIAGGIILAIPFLMTGRRINIFRLAMMSVALVLAFAILTQIDFVASRFGDDPNAANNIADRLSSTLAGLSVLLTNPMGMPFNDFISLVASGSGGIESPHNGFIFFGGIFGLLPLAAILAAFAVNFRVRDDVDIFFALLTLVICISLMFEQLPGSYSYAFTICLVGAHAFLKTGLGGQLKARPAPLVFRRAT
jgi:hypothetical protein